MKIFLGYASEHIETAREVFDFLKTLNDDVWFDKESLVGGDDWDRERAAAQREADFVIHLISAEVFARPGVVNREISQTLRQIDDQPIGTTYVVFVRLDDVRMPAELIRFQYVDYFKATWRDQLAEAVSKRLGQLHGTPPQVAPEAKRTVTEGPLLDGGAARAAHVSFSVSTELYEVTAGHLQYPSGGVYWDFINARLAVDALGGFVGIIADFNRMDNHDIERIEQVGQRYEWDFLMQEFFRRGDLLSVRSSVYWYSGGAHGNHSINTLNFLGPDYSLCPITDLLANSEENAFRLTEYCKKVLLATFENKGLEDYISRSFEDRQNTWNLLRQFNFDDKGLTVNFSPYEVLPYAFGSHEVIIPWRFATPLLADQYQHLEDRLSEGLSS